MSAYTDFRSVSGATDASLDFLASHPNAPQRIELAQRHARQFGSLGQGARDRDSFLAGIDGLLYGDTPEEGYVRGNTFLHPRLGISFSVPPGFVIDNSAAAVTATGPGELAVRFDGVTLNPRTQLPDYIRSGWVAGLDPSQHPHADDQRQRSSYSARSSRRLEIRHHGDQGRRPGLPAADGRTYGKRPARRHGADGRRQLQAALRAREG